MCADRPLFPHRKSPRTSGGANGHCPSSLNTRTHGDIALSNGLGRLTGAKLSNILSTGSELGRIADEPMNPTSEPLSRRQERHAASKRPVAHEAGRSLTDGTPAGTQSGRS